MHMCLSRVTVCEAYAQQELGCLAGCLYDMRLGNVQAGSLLSAWQGLAGQIAAGPLPGSALPAVLQPVPNHGTLFLQYMHRAHVAATVSFHQCS